MPINEDKLYEEIGHAWQYYVSWREKIFAGYLTVLAGLALAFSQNSGVHVRAAVCAFGIVVSVVFWILDVRTTELVNLCQAAGESFAGSSGFYTELNRRRFEKAERLSYGTAIGVLVASVIGTSMAGLSAHLLWWWRSSERVGLWWCLAAFVLAFGVFKYLRRIAHVRWLDEQEKYKSRVSRG